MGLAHFQRAGHKVLALVGGATAMIGDPSGKSDERNLLDLDRIAHNVDCCKKQLAHFLDFDGDNAAIVLNNVDWIAKMSFVDWLRDVGKHFTINSMVAKDSVRRRIESEQGISFTEFSYLTMQAYDFLHLFDRYTCTLQCGGSDQWGNITAGVDLIRKVRRKSAYGITFPLITSASGEKLGKTAGNAIWLDPDRTSPWDLYQYFVRLGDQDVIRCLKTYTFVSIEEIVALESSVASEPEKRKAQNALAHAVTQLVHGKEVADEMARAADIVYQSEIKDLSDATLLSVFASVPSTTITWAQLDEGLELLDVMAEAGIVKSKGEARRLLQGGGVYVNNVQIDEEISLGRDRLASDSFIVLRIGKKNYHLLCAK